MVKNADGLTVKEARFVPLLFQLGGNATEAYVQAGFKAKNRHSAEQAASALLRKVEVAAAIEKQRSAMVAKLEEKAEISRQWVLEGLKANYERAMTAEAVLDAKGKPTGEYTYNGSVANRSLELIGKEIGMFVEKSERDGTIRHEVVIRYEGGPVIDSTARELGDGD